MLQIFLAVLGGSIGMLVLMWTIVYAIQYVRPDGPLPLHKDPELVRRIQLKAGMKSKVRFSDIRNLERSRVLFGQDDDDYQFIEGSSTGWPEAWVEDLYRRRN